MADIGAELQEIIRKRFMKAVNHDTIAQKYQWQILSGTATFEQAEKYAPRLRWSDRPLPRVAWAGFCVVNINKI